MEAVVLRAVVGGRNAGLVAAAAAAAAAAATTAAAAAAVAVAAPCPRPRRALACAAAAAAAAAAAPPPAARCGSAAVAARAEEALDLLVREADGMRAQQVLDSFGPQLLAGAVPGPPSARAGLDPRPAVHVVLSPAAVRRVAQFSAEEHAIESSAERYRAELANMKKIGRAASLRPSQRMILTWFPRVRDSIAREQRLVRSRQSVLPLVHEHGAYLLQLDADRAAVVAIHTLLGGVLQSGRIRATFAARNAGNAFLGEVSLKLMRRTSIGLSKHFLKRRPSYYKMMNWARRETPQGTLPTSHGVFWIGDVLVGKVLQCAMLPRDDGGGGGVEDAAAAAAEEEEEVPAFTRSGADLVADPRLLDVLEEGREFRTLVGARLLPMVCVPRPWSSLESGGYLMIPVPMVRLKEGNRHVRAALARAPLEKLMRGLDVLGRTAWCVNGPVFQVAQEAWKIGGLGDLPSHIDIALPPEPPPGTPEHRLWVKTMHVVRQRNQDLHSMRCDTRYKLAIAREFLGETFYFPHSVDFRGRSYPIPPHMSHIGSDLCRGVLEFAEARPCGKRGVFWLKVLLANLAGLSKQPLEARAQWAEEHLHDIFDSADFPLGGGRWWLRQESPWQCLAACFALARVLRAPRPEDAPCSLPIQMDGSCNGLQHYAALGGDAFGAAQVNLVASDSPMDVYTGILDLVNERIVRDARDDHPLARKVVGRIKRKVVKQTVMTSVYGVTLIGARRQIYNALKDVGIVSPDDLYPVSSYIAGLTFSALREMFAGARTIMDWLTACAALIAKEGAPVEWVTPLGLVCAQPYRAVTSRTHVRTLVQSLPLKPAEELPVDRKRQRSAFPPNYIHCLDSSHMFLTALACERHGITFASVHDSFWTHAATTDELHTLLREAFVELHQRPLLEDLLRNFRLRHPHVQFPPVPPRGEFDFKAVLKSTFFFS